MSTTRGELTEFAGLDMLPNGPEYNLPLVTVKSSACGWHARSLINLTGREASAPPNDDLLNNGTRRGTGSHIRHSHCCAKRQLKSVRLEHTTHKRAPLGKPLRRCELSSVNSVLANSNCKGFYFVSSRRMAGRE